jgi:1-hydroxycarotenoid 3,4-desaturase
MPPDRIVVIGAGIAGLAAALELAAAGREVVVVERAASPGGKMRESVAGTQRLDAGPTVLTMRWVLEELFDTAGARLEDHLMLRPLELLARHAWSESEQLDLHVDVARSADAIGRFAGAREAQGFRTFVERARRIYATLEHPFIRAPRATPQALVAAVGLRRLGELWRIAPFSTLWDALGEHFRDPRLRQLFGRYATYCGASPFLAPATLMLVAAVELEGVWLVEGGMHRIATALAALAMARGATFRFGTAVSEVIVAGGRVAGVRLSTGETLTADAVIVNADVAAIAAGRLGAAIAGMVPPVAPAARSLSATTWLLSARTSGFPLVRHNVFFSRNYAAEFEDIFRHHRLPREPTVYVCAQDRHDATDAAPSVPERLLCLVNAPPTGDTNAYTTAEIERCETRTFELLGRCGLEVERRAEATTVVTPADFERMFPSTGGALYGRASHGWRASFQRPGVRAALPGLYFASGSTHPGPGVPMAALAGRAAARSLMADRASTVRFRRAAMPGGMSMR